jgi:exodeoxyribonuclease VII large subunit
VQAALAMIELNPAPPGRFVWGVAALVQAVADALTARFSPCAVRGEISGFSRASSGHCYFNLKDANGGGALIRCAMFRRAATLLDFSPSDGQSVELRGRLGVYEARGELQLVVESMQRAGAGALYEQFLRLKAKLEGEGLFDPSRKRALPAYPRAVGVVTSLGAAVLRDVVTTLARRSPHVQVIVYPCAVQGAEAPASICEALAIAAVRNEVDTLILCRGGGSLEDLWSFNDERVVRAIAASPIPLISGVGHETDATLSDFAADLRAPTPTAAAELVAPETQACLRTLGLMAELLQRRSRDLLDGRAQRLDTLALRLARPADSVRSRAHAFDILAHRFLTATRRGVEQRRNLASQLQDRMGRSAAVLLSARERQLSAMDARLTSLDPKHVLARGYAWLTNAAGRPVSSAFALGVGERLEAQLVDGSASVEVTGVNVVGRAPIG